MAVPPNFLTHLPPSVQKAIQRRETPPMARAAQRATPSRARPSRGRAAPPKPRGPTTAELLKQRIERTAKIAREKEAARKAEEKRIAAQKKIEEIRKIAAQKRIAATKQTQAQAAKRTAQAQAMAAGKTGIEAMLIAKGGAAARLGQQLVTRREAARVPSKEVEPPKPVVDRLKRMQEIREKRGIPTPLPVKRLIERVEAVKHVTPIIEPTPAVTPFEAKPLVPVEEKIPEEVVTTVHAPAEPVFGVPGVLPTKVVDEKKVEEVVVPRRMMGPLREGTRYETEAEEAERLGIEPPFVGLPAPTEEDISFVERAPITTKMFEPAIGIPGIPFSTALKSESVQLITEKTKDAPKVLTSEGQQDWAVKELIKEGELPSYYEGYSAKNIFEAEKQQGAANWEINRITGETPESSREYIDQTRSLKESMRQTTNPIVKDMFRKEIGDIEKEREQIEQTRTTEMTDEKKNIDNLQKRYFEEGVSETEKFKTFDKLARAVDEYNKDATFLGKSYVSLDNRINNDVIRNIKKKNVEGFLGMTEEEYRRNTDTQLIFEDFNQDGISYEGRTFDPNKDSYNDIVNYMTDRDVTINYSYLTKNIPKAWNAKKGTYEPLGSDAADEYKKIAKKFADGNISHYDFNKETTNLLVDNQIDSEGNKGVPGRFTHFGREKDYKNVMLDLSLGYIDENAANQELGAIIKHELQTSPQWEGWVKEYMRFDNPKIADYESKYKRYVENSKEKFGKMGGAEGGSVVIDGRSQFLSSEKYAKWWLKNNPTVEKYIADLTEDNKNDVKWNVIKKDEPALYLKRDDLGNVSSSMDVLRYKKGKWKEMSLAEQASEAFLVGATQFPKTVYHTVATPFGAKTEDLQRELAGFAYSAERHAAAKDFAGFLGEDIIMSPAVTDVILPLTMGVGFSAVASVGAKAFAGTGSKLLSSIATKTSGVLPTKLATALTKAGITTVNIGKVTTSTGKILANPWIQRTMISAPVAADIGRVAAMEQHGLVAPGSTAKAMARGGMIIGMFSFGGSVVGRQPLGLKRIPKVTGTKVPDPYGFKKMTPSQAKHVHRQLSLKYHPDKVLGSTEKFRIIQKSYEAYGQAPAVAPRSTIAGVKKKFVEFKGRFKTPEGAIPRERALVSSEKPQISPRGFWKRPIPKEALDVGELGLVKVGKKPFVPGAVEEKAMKLFRPREAPFVPGRTIPGEVPRATQLTLKKWVDIKGSKLTIKPVTEIGKIEPVIPKTTLKKHQLERLAKLSSKKHLTQTESNALKKLLNIQKQIKKEAALEVIKKPTTEFEKPPTFAEMQEMRVRAQLGREMARAEQLPKGQRVLERFSLTKPTKLPGKGRLSSTERMEYRAFMKEQQNILKMEARLAKTEPAIARTQLRKEQLTEIQRILDKKVPLSVYEQAKLEAIKGIPKKQISLRSRVKAKPERMPTRIKAKRLRRKLDIQRKVEIRQAIKATEMKGKPSIPEQKVTTHVKYEYDKGVLRKTTMTKLGRKKIHQFTDIVPAEPGPQPFKAESVSISKSGQVEILKKRIEPVLRKPEVKTKLPKKKILKPKKKPITQKEITKYKETERFPATRGQRSREGLLEHDDYYYASGGRLSPSDIEALEEGIVTTHPRWARIGPKGPALKTSAKTTGLATKPTTRKLIGGREGISGTIKKPAITQDIALGLALQPAQVQTSLQAQIMRQRLGQLPEQEAIQRPDYAMALGMTPATATATAQEQAATQAQAQAQAQEQAQDQALGFAFPRFAPGRAGKYEPRPPEKPPRQYQFRLDLPGEKPKKKIEIPKKLRKRAIGYKERKYEVPKIWGAIEKQKKPEYFKPPKSWG